MRAIAAAVVLCTLEAAAAFGQDFSTTAIDTEAGALKFEAVSIKPSDPDSCKPPGYGPASLVYVRGDTVYGRCATLEMMVSYAYKLFRFEGGKQREIEGPGLLRSTKYELIAKPAGPATIAQQRLMMRNMLAERFHLAVHVENRPTDVYVLEVAKNGPKLKESSDPPERARPGPSAVFSKAGTIDDLASHIALWVLQTPVLNRTGLTGHYKYRLEYANPNLDARSPIPGEGAAGSESPPATSEAPAIFNAVREQLGLKLTLRKMPLPVLIVDRAEPPTEN